MRQQFIYSSATCLAAVVTTLGFDSFEGRSCEAAVGGDIRGKVFKGDVPEKPRKYSREGFLYKKLKNHKVVCGICPNSCILDPGDRSVCRSKVNLDGKLYSLTYGNPCSVNTDPIEKTAFPFQTPHKCLFAGHHRVQFPLLKLSELGNFPGKTP